MTAQLAQIWRHPIKSHGREALEQVSLTAGQTLPWDRCWAVAHEAARIDGSEWAPCANFSRGAKAPKLMGISARLNEADETVTLTHPEQPEITLHPERDSDDLMAWVKPLMPTDRAQSSHVIRVPERGMTDTPFASISIANLASNAAVGEVLKRELDPARWRANLWIEGLEPWDETEWVGKSLRVGPVEIEIREQITRCLATTVNPETSVRDADTLGVLDGLGHQEFGVYGVVTQPGAIRLGDPIELI